MPNKYGEVDYTDPKLPDDAMGLAQTIIRHNTVTCTLAAFATATQVTAITKAAVESGVEEGHRRPPGIGEPGDDDYTLWLAGTGTGTYIAAWLHDDSPATPWYLKEKGLSRTAPDALALAVLIRLINWGRGARVSDDMMRVEADILDWAREVGREAPAWITEAGNPLTASND